MKNLFIVVIASSCLLPNTSSGQLESFKDTIAWLSSKLNFNHEINPQVRRSTAFTYDFGSKVISYESKTPVPVEYDLDTGVEKIKWTCNDKKKQCFKIDLSAVDPGGIRYEVNTARSDPRAMMVTENGEDPVLGWVTLPMKDLRARYEIVVSGRASESNADLVRRVQRALIYTVGRCQVR